MTNQDYEQKKRECWEEFKRTNLDSEVQWQPVNRYDVFCAAFDRAYALGKHEMDAEDDKTLKVNRQLFCRLCADADDYINEHLEEEDSDYTYYQGRSDALHELYRGECKDAEDTVFQGWACRDEDNTLTIFYGSNKPSKEDGDDYWSAVFGDSIEYLPQNMFPDVTWDDPEPTRVEIIIRRKKNG